MMSEITPRTVRRHTQLGGAAVVAIVALAACFGDSLAGPVSPVMSNVRASQNFTCAVGELGRALCWGHNDRGQLGSDTVGESVAFPHVVSETLNFRQVSTKPAARHVCGVTTTGDAYCWGENNFGQIGRPPTASNSGPQRVPGDLTFASISAGWRSTCGVTTDGHAYCWGRGEWGQLGDGLTEGSDVPVLVAGGHTFQKVDVGSNNLVCGLTTGGAILCWGLDLAGALGAPSMETCVRRDGLELPCATTPQPITSEELFVDVTAGLSYACGVTGSKQAFCWGRNDGGQLGRPTTEVCAEGGLQDIECGRTPSVTSGSVRLVSLSAGTFHTCGVTDAGAAYCWGSNSLGQLGSGLVGTNSSAPAQVRGPVTFRTVSAGNEHTCGEGLDGALYCWGANQWGQLGTGDLQLWLEPARVVGLP
jgi:alpha-tubulin suppressor-like RCC1 family protein